MPALGVRTFRLRPDQRAADAPNPRGRVRDAARLDPDQRLLVLDVEQPQQGRSGKGLAGDEKAGINRAFIGNIKDGRIPDGPVKVFSDEWWDILHTALKTAGELGIDIGIFNSPGWSQSGGPWVKPEQAMRYLASSETHVTGPQRLVAKLPRRTNCFRMSR